MKEIRVALFDDNDIRRDGVELLLKTTEGYVCCGSYEHAGNLVAELHDAQPDVVIMDIDMPGIDGIEAVRILKGAFPNLPVMMQTVFDHDEKVFESILAGATGYLLKKTPPVKLLEAISEMHDGGAPMTPEIAAKVLAFFAKQNTPEP
ncbi:MAG TPA: response regulator transcription factor, partial [Chitinophagales bacterium]|nr:DNA-binding response regulator [Bacteroidota bacterium]HQU75350.1 response regulator transcription factor [Chitinophagales bacterium]